MYWGELIALRPRHIDFLRRTLTVAETIIEISRTHSPTGQRFIPKPYPKDNESRTFGVRQDWLDAMAERINTEQIGRDDLLFTTKVGTPISRDSFRTPRLAPGRQSQRHRLQRPHPRPPPRPRLLAPAGGSDLKSVMDRLGHAQTQTTQKYLHSLPDADQRNLDALNRITRRHE